MAKLQVRLRDFPDDILFAFNKYSVAIRPPNGPKFDVNLEIGTISGNKCPLQRGI